MDVYSAVSNSVFHRLSGKKTFAGAKYDNFISGPSAPIITNVTRPSMTSIQVEWRRPNITYRQIDQYRLVYRPLNLEGDTSSRVHIASSSTNSPTEVSHPSLKEVMVFFCFYTGEEMRILNLGATRSLSFLNAWALTTI